MLNVIAILINIAAFSVHWVYFLGETSLSFIDFPQ